MKYLVVSDIHGSGYYAKKIKEINEKENPDKIILLGDLYYHGPRNPLTDEYGPMNVAGVLNDLSDKILCTRGNCDADVDEFISEFKFKDNIRLTIGKLKFFFSHGHYYNSDNIPEDADVVVYGHFHTGFIKEEYGIIFTNPGSIALPKNGTANSYMIIDEEHIILKDVDGNIIEERKLK